LTVSEMMKEEDWQHLLMHSDKIANTSPHSCLLGSA